MDWFREINWYAIHVRRYRESLAAASVAALGLEAFLPMVKVERLPNQVIKLDAKPLFAGYFFARFSPEDSLTSVECARGVLQVIKSGGRPIPVEAEIIEEIRERVEVDGLIRLKHPQLKPGDRVSIQEGPFAGLLGRVEAELDDRKRVAVLVEALWNARVLIEKQWVEVEAA